jgi:hypothetical protein
MNNSDALATIQGCVTIRGFVNFEIDIDKVLILLITESLEEYELEHNEKAQELLDQIDMDVEVSGHLVVPDKGRKKLTLVDYKIIDHSA